MEWWEHGSNCAAAGTSQLARNAGASWRPRRLVEVPGGHRVDPRTFIEQNTGNHEADFGGDLRLPFAVDEAQLQGAPGQCWIVAEQQNGADEVSLRLGAITRLAQAQLDGFKSRPLRAEAGPSAQAPTQQHLYITEWRELIPKVPPRTEVALVVVSDDSLRLAGCERLSSTSSVTQLVAKLDEAAWSAAVVAVATQHGQTERDALYALEVALLLLQVQAGSAPVPDVWLLTACAQQAHGAPGAAHAGGGRRQHEPRHSCQCDALTAR